VETSAPAVPRQDDIRGAVLVSIAALGLSSIATQLSLLRELLGAFSGNELVLGICLGNWFALTAAGAWIGAAAARLRRPGRVFVAGQFAAALIPLAQVAAVRGLRDVVFLRGEAVGLAGAWLGSLALLAPYCLAAGALLTLGCGIVGAGGRRSGVGPVYLADAAGSVAGGALFVFVLVPRFDHFALLCVPAFLNLSAGAFLAWRLRAPAFFATGVILACGLVLQAALFNADAATTSLQHRGERVVFRANSPYGRLIVCDSSGLLTFYENGVPVAATENTAQVEEAVHYAMCQRPRARKVLLIGGGMAGDAREILRYPSVDEVSYVELDPAIIAAGRRLIPGNLEDPRIRVAAADGRRFVQESRGAFDIVIVDLPDPSTSQLNRYYTAGFFAEAHRALKPGGVLAFGLGRYENFVGPELARLLASARRTLGGAFLQVVMIPGGRVFFLASDGALTMDIAGRLEAIGIHPRLVNRHYLDAMLSPDRLADIDRAVARPAALNTDESPVLYYYELRRWLSQFGRLSTALGVALALALAAYFAALGPVPRIIFSAGFAASGLEIVLLLGFQMLYGSVYRQVGLVVTFFMAGLAAGAWFAGRAKSRLPPVRRLSLAGVAIACLAAAVPLVLRASAAFGAAAGTEFTGQGCILLATLLLAVFVGAQFPPAAAASPAGGGEVPARLFSADLIGAAVGALLVSSILIPLLGVTAVCLLTAGLNAATAALAWGVSPCTPSILSA
jgi:spermidine synthase